MKLSWNVMISSTMRDLALERQAIFDVIGLEGMVAWWAEEPPVEFPPAPEAFCRAMAERCDLFLLVVGPRYGFAPDGTPTSGKSVTWMEFDWARHESARKVRVFVRADANDQADPRQEAFLHELQTWSTGHIYYQPFTSIEQLQAQARTALQDWLSTNECGRQAWLRSVRARTGLIPNPLTGQSMPTSHTEMLPLRWERDRRRQDRRTWDESLLQPGSAVGNMSRLWKQPERFQPQKPPAHDGEKDLMQPEIVAARDLLRRRRRLLVVGDPGSGKSTLLWQLAHEQATASLAERFALPPLPVLATATELLTVPNLPVSQSSSPKLPDASSALVNERAPLAATTIATLTVEVVTQQLRAAGTAEATIAAISVAIEDAVSRGELVLFVDGWDEIDENRRGRLRPTLQRMAENAAVIASRPAALQRQEWPDWELCEVQQIDSEHRRHLIVEVFRTVAQAQPLYEADAAEFERALDRRPDLRAWSTNPLLLTLMAAQFGRFGTFPENQASLYALAVAELLEQRRTAATERLDPPQMVRALRTVALEMQRRNLVTATPREILQLVATDRGFTWTSDEVVELLARSALLQQQSPGQWGFIHVTFQEYLVAEALATLPETARREELIRRRLSSRWQSALILLVLILEERGEFHAAEAVIATLVRADGRRVPSLRHRDRTHAALLAATRCQAARASPGEGPAADLIRRHWRRMRWESDLARLPQISFMSFSAGIPVLSEFVWEVFLDAPYRGVIGSIASMLWREPPPRGWLVWMGRLFWCTLVTAILFSILAPLAVLVAGWVQGPTDAFIAQLVPIVAFAFTLVLIVQRLVVRNMGLRFWMARTILMTLNQQTSSDLITLSSVWLPRIGALLSSPVPQDRELAAKLVRFLGPRAVPILPHLVDLLRDPYRDVQHAVEAAVEAVGSAAIPQILQLVHKPDTGRQLLGLEALLCLKSAAAPALPELIALLSDPSREENVRAAAAMTISAIGPAAAPALPALIAYLQASTWQGRNAAIRAIGALGPGAAEAIPALMREFQKKDQLFLSGIIDALGALGPDGVAALADILSTSPSLAVVDAVGMVIPRLGNSAMMLFPELFSVLLKAEKMQEEERQEQERDLDDTGVSYSLRLHVATDFAIAALGPKALEALLPFLDSDDVRARRAATSVISSTRLNARGFVAFLIARLRTPNNATAMRALEQIREFPTTALPEIEAILVDPDTTEDVHTFLLNLLYTRRLIPTDSRVVSLLIAHARTRLHEVDVYAQAYTASVLGDLGPVAVVALPDLLNLLRLNADQHGYSMSHLRQEVVQAIGKMGPQAADAALLTLRSLLYSTDQELVGYPGRTMQEVAIEAVGRLGPRAAQLLPDLLVLTRSGSASVKWRALLAASRVASDAGRIMPSARRLLRDRVENVRSQAIGVMENMCVREEDGRRVVRWLRIMFSSRYTDVHEGALQILERVGWRHPAYYASKLNHLARRRVVLLRLVGLRAIKILCDWLPLILFAMLQAILIWPGLLESLKRLPVSDSFMAIRDMAVSILSTLDQSREWPAFFGAALAYIVVNIVLTALLFFAWSTPAMTDSATLGAVRERLIGEIDDAYE